MIRINLLGDLSLNDSFVTSKECNYYRFNKILPCFDDNSYTFANVEAPIKGCEDDLDPQKKLYIYTEVDVLKEILPLLNIKIVSLANNHIADYGVSGIENTITALDELGILHTGAGTKVQHVDPVVFTLNNHKVAFCAYVDKNTNPSGETISGILINYFSEEKVINDIKGLRSCVDKIVVSIHWGRDYSNYYTKDQKIIAHHIIDAGADIIMGHHPHTIQPYEIYKGKLIFYSLGQLCYGDFYWEGHLRALKRKTKSGMLIKVNIQDVLDFNIIPTKESEGNYIALSSKSLNLKMQRLSHINQMRFNNRLLDWLLRVKESLSDRIIEYFVGYYRKPFKQLIKLKNIVKVKYLFRDYKHYR